MRGKRPLRVRQRHVRSQRKTLFVWKGFRARPLFVTKGWTPMTVRFAVKPKRCKHLSFNSRQRNALWSMYAMRGWSGVEENEEKRWGRVGATSTRAARMPRAAHLARCAPAHAARAAQPAHLARFAHLSHLAHSRGPSTDQIERAAQPIRRICALRYLPDLGLIQSRSDRSSESPNCLSGRPRAGAPAPWRGRQPWPWAPRPRLLQGRAQTLQMPSERTVNVQ